MNENSTKANDRIDQVSSRRDRGTTFLEVLVATVLLGLAGVATMTALSVSIQGSDQHKSKVGALAELEGAGAYLARESNTTNCTTSPNISMYETILASRPGTRNDGVTVTVDAVDCTSGLPLVSLTATHVKGNATESLDVTVGGISVVKNGNGSGGLGGPGAGSCTWGTASATPVSVNKQGSKLRESVTIRLAYTNNCSLAAASARVYQTAPTPKSITLSMTNTGSSIFEATLAKDAVNWDKGDVFVTITTVGPPGTFTTSFKVT